ncbi:hypothetical protein EDB84DRAFT_1447258 [Lactarius hengduanensis]|nr:hypothetical protein EDB84DRAFT_1447258 [Lactarius hengduanensis]KAH9011304.1 hypothetical protein EDB85DRAFT_1901165 [Lactarius pseudohatsudake]
MAVWLTSSFSKNWIAPPNVIRLATSDRETFLPDGWSRTNVIGTKMILYIASLESVSTTPENYGFNRLPDDTSTTQSAFEIKSGVQMFPFIIANIRTFPANIAPHMRSHQESFVSSSSPKFYTILSRSLAPEPDEPDHERVTTQKLRCSFCFIQSKRGLYLRNAGLSEEYCKIWGHPSSTQIVDVLGIAMGIAYPPIGLHWFSAEVRFPRKVRSGEMSELAGNSRDWALREDAGGNLDGVGLIFPRILTTSLCQLSVIPFYDSSFTYEI